MPDPDLFVVHLQHLLGAKLGLRVLDAGSGAGRNANYLRATGHQVTCIDIARTALQKTSGDRVQSDVATLPFAEATFDAALCTSVLESVPSESACAAANELTRVLRPGGHLLVVAAAAEGSDESYSTEAPGLALEARLTTRPQLDEWFGHLECLELLHLRLEVPTAAVRAQWALIARKSQ